ncbi:hypothetical protein JZ751_004471 [Albula glossodonta]|uniref:Alpha-aspartyl dipeptidase n=1 Tax=Albula glossodonta TaxID=121402 RepID=A0A8T2NGJ0_9TELE|nr:hypothetical protein JZ751_004471 [Albula glossodonta]
MKRRLLLVSNSTLHGGGYLGHCEKQIQEFFGENVKRILFVPYALHDRDAYAKTARDKLQSLGYAVDSIHETADPVEAVKKAEGIFIGTNVSTISINTTNDMPIVYPPTLAAIGLVPFNINPHYLDPDPSSKHMGETREQRIQQYHEEPNTPSVLVSLGCPTRHRTPTTTALTL